MEHKILMAGFGGQGIMAMGQLVTYAGMVEGKQVSWMPSYGPEMRGGSANCSVIVSDRPVGSPTVNMFNIGVFMNQVAFDKFIENAEKDAHIFVNSSLIESKVDRDDVHVYYIPVNEIAQEKIGNARTANMVMLGSILEAVDIVDRNTVMDVFTKVFGEKRAKLKPINDQAMQAGADAINEQKTPA
ncbi:MAG: 2-oxoacid:acceptor oxidoreductase family protein [Peptoniphilaceae bacterium]|jgi:2-oxoglutarate ferredoxin oxidoreductase subunit gamma